MRMCMLIMLMCSTEYRAKLLCAIFELFAGSSCLLSFIPSGTAIGEIPMWHVVGCNTKKQNDTCAWTPNSVLKNFWMGNRC
jgi:hypothetical protein